MSCRSREHDMCTAGPLAALMCSDTMSDRVDDEEARTAKLIVSERRKERRRSADAPASDARGGNDITGRDRAWVNYEATGAVIESAETTPPPPSPPPPPEQSAPRSCLRSPSGGSSSSRRVSFATIIQQAEGRLLSPGII